MGGFEAVQAPVKEPDSLDSDPDAVLVNAVKRLISDNRTSNSGGAPICGAVTGGAP